MKFEKSQLDSIYRRTTGYCHLCHVKLARRNYGKTGMKGAWQVEHSVPRSKGGTDHFNNLFAACVDLQSQQEQHDNKDCAILERQGPRATWP